jgi:hypothetical protein
MRTLTNTKNLKLISRKEVKLEVFEFKSHTLGELLKATIIRNKSNEIVKVINFNRVDGWQEQLTSWEFQHASHDLHRKLKGLVEI